MERRRWRGDGEGDLERWPWGGGGEGDLVEEDVRFSSRKTWRGGLEEMERGAGRGGALLLHARRDVRCRSRDFVVPQKKSPPMLPVETINRRAERKKEREKAFECVGLSTATTEISVIHVIPRRHHFLP